MPRKRRKSSVKKEIEKMQKQLPPPSEKAKKSGCATAVLSFIIFFAVFIGFTSCMSRILSGTKRQTTATEPAALIQTEAPTAAPTEQPTEAPTEAPTEPEPTAEPEPKILHFIVNTDSGCVHSDPHCSAAEAIAADHRAEIDIPAAELSGYRGIYWACGRCCTSEERQALPKE